MWKLLKPEFLKLLIISSSIGIPLTFNIGLGILFVRGFNLENNCETLGMEEDNYENKMIDNIINNDNDQNDILKTINQQLSNILFRLDNIEKRLYSKDINPNFFKERKKINERFYKGKKVVDIHIDRNVNGKKSSSHKTIDYDSDGNKNIKTTIPNNNI